MSISTLESPASRRALDARHASQDRIAGECRGVEQEIKTAFHLLGVVPSNAIALPAVDHLAQREGAVTLRAAVLELLQDGQCDDELMAVLEHGTGELVDALRGALQAKYIERTAADVAAYRV